MYKNRDKIDEWLKNHEIKNFTIKEDLTVDVDHEVRLNHYNIAKLPVQFGVVKGNFWINNNNLSTLEGSPKIVIDGNFYCHSNKLTSLKEGPILVFGGYYCYKNCLKTLEGAPQRIYGSFDCSDNKNLQTLKGIPLFIRDDFRCDDCPNLGTDSEDILYTIDLLEMKYGHIDLTKIYDILNCHLT